MLMQIAGGIAALAAAVLVAFLVPMLIQLRKTAKESDRLLRQLNADLPVLLLEMTQVARNMNQVTTDVREGAARARLLGDALGEVGQTMIRLNGLVRSRTGNLLMNMGGLLAGFRAAFEVLRQR